MVFYSILQLLFVRLYNMSKCQGTLCDINDIQHNQDFGPNHPFDFHKFSHQTTRKISDTAKTYINTFAWKLLAILKV